jgi:hypothetical protein
MPWVRATTVWLLLMVVESIHGTLRQWFLAPLIGDLPARRVAVFSGSLLIFLITLGTVRWMTARGSKNLLAVGALWVVLTVTFECVLGRAVFGYDWPRLLEDYDVSRGGLMGIGLLSMLFTPIIAARLVLRTA